jgi:hypothetical protein
LTLANARVRSSRIRGQCLSSFLSRLITLNPTELPDVPHTSITTLSY